jgi:hypothetical protein
MLEQDKQHIQPDLTHPSYTTLNISTLRSAKIAYRMVSGMLKCNLVPKYNVIWGKRLGIGYWKFSMDVLIKKRKKITTSKIP